MSSSNSGTARRRLGLLAGGSLAAATVLLAAGGVALTPTAARAANECGNPATNGATADTFQCTDAAPFASITYPSTSGNLTLQLQNDVTVTTGGIVITPTGANTVSITRIADSAPASGDPQIASTTGAGISVIRPTGNNGNITVNLTDNDADDAPMSVSGTTAGILLSNAGTGTTTLTTTNGAISASAGVAVQLGTVGTGAVTFTNRSTVSGTTGAVSFTGVNVTMTNGPGGVILGKVDFGNTGTSQLTNLNGSVWRVEGVNNMGSGDGSRLNNDGVLAIGGAVQGASTLTLSGLETMVGGGRILFGSNSAYTATDGFANDRLVTTAAFSGAGVLVMDVVLGGAQADCAAAVTADCFDLRGGTAEGPDPGSSLQAASILVNPIAGTGALGVRQVLVDVSGAGSASERAFVLNAGNAGYRTVPNELSLIDTGPVVYRLLYDDDAQQFYLIGAPDAEVAQLAHLSEGVQAAWDLTTDGWLSRQANLRADPDGAGHGVWLGALYGSVENAVGQSFSDGAFVYDTSYVQRTQGVVGGVDVLASEGLRAGLTAGYVSSEIETDKYAAPLSYELKGYTVGAYASVQAGGLFLDAIVNYASFDIGSDSLSEESESTSLGVQAEAGYRFTTPAGIVTIEPLVAVAYLNTDIGEAAFANGSSVVFDDATSLRAALGLRVAGEMGSDVTTRFSFTGRIWESYENETSLGVAGVGGSLVYEDDRGTLGDLAASVGVFGLSEGLSLDATARLKIKEDYNAGELSLGVRYAF